jgi:hypothetical protein
MRTHEFLGGGLTVSSSKYIPEGQFVEHEFPMFDCLLQNGKFSSEIAMTLYYAYPLHPDSGAEW